MRQELEAVDVLALLLADGVVTQGVSAGEAELDVPELEARLLRAGRTGGEVKHPGEEHHRTQPPDRAAGCVQPGFPIWIDFRLRGGVHRADRPVGQPVQPPPTG